MLYCSLSYCRLVMLVCVNQCSQVLRSQMNDNLCTCDMIKTWLKVIYGLACLIFIPLPFYLLQYLLAVFPPGNDGEHLMTDCWRRTIMSGTTISLSLLLLLIIIILMSERRVTVQLLQHIIPLHLLLSSHPFCQYWLNTWSLVSL